MKRSTEKFLEFNGKSVSFLNVDGQWWVAVRPICDALGVHYQHQLERLKDDEILNELYGEYSMVAADGKLRKMICLPEKYTYGWLFSIRSESPDLAQFKRECYEVLFDHFHGGLRSKLLTEQIINHVELQKLQAELDAEIGNNPLNVRIKELTAENVRLGKLQARIIKDEKAGLIDMFRDKDK